MLFNPLLALVLAVGMATMAHLFFKKGASTLPSIEPSLAQFFNFVLKAVQNWWVLSGVVFFAVSFVLYLYILNKFQLNVIYPIMVGGGILLIAFLSIFTLRESFSLYQLVGSFLIILGIWFLLPKG